MYSKSEPASAPVGTTVKVTDFFKQFPVRKQNALKDSAKSLINIRRLMQAYALARPTVRFSLRVLKSKSNKNDFMYAPKKDGNIEDAVLKVFGKGLALQCEWSVIESNGFEVHAFLPKPNADPAKIANQGTFISVDARPISTARGTSKKIVAAFKERLQKANTKLSSAKNAFFYANIICPPGSYDPNIEPAKNDVLFEDEDLVTGAVNKLLIAYYPEAVVEIEEEAVEAVPSIPSSDTLGPDDDQHSDNFPEVPIHVQDDLPTEIDKSELQTYRPISPAKDQPQWRSTMYGIDEEDLEFVGTDPIPVIEEEEGIRDVAVSNPWTIAKVNVRNKQPLPNQQLMSPAKSIISSDGPFYTSSPSATPRQQAPKILLTPRTSSKTRTGMPSPGVAVQSLSESTSMHSERLPGPSQNISTDALSVFNSQPEKTNSSLLDSRRLQSKAVSRKKSTRQSEVEEPYNEWTHQPKRVSNKPRSRKPKGQHDSDHGAGKDDHMYSENNADIRDFFGGNNRSSQSNTMTMSAQDSELPSFTPINSGLQELRSKLVHPESNRQLTLMTSSSQGSSGIAQTGSINRRKCAEDGTLLDPRHEAFPQIENISKMPHEFTAKRVLRRPSTAQVPVVTDCNIQNLPLNLDQPFHDARGPSKSSKQNGSSMKHQDIAAQLTAYANQEDRVCTSRPSLRRPQARVPPIHEIAKVRPSHREQVSSIRRRQSSGKSVEYMPSEHCISHIEVLVKTSVDQIVRLTQMLDMTVEGGNSIEWGHTATANPRSIHDISTTDSEARSLAMDVLNLLDDLFEREEDDIKIGIDLQTSILKHISDTAQVEVPDPGPEPEGKWKDQLVTAAASNPPRSPPTQLSGDFGFSHVPYNDDQDDSDPPASPRLTHFHDLDETTCTELTEGAGVMQLERGCENTTPYHSTPTETPPTISAPPPTDQSSTQAKSPIKYLAVQGKKAALDEQHESDYGEEIVEEEMLFGF